VLSSTASVQLQSARIQTTRAVRRRHVKTKQKHGEIDQLRLFTFKREFQKISVDLQTALATGTHLSEGQWLEEQTEHGKYLCSE
jgi:translation initiation factor 1 (eIF-1/SUI1)